MEIDIKIDSKKLEATIKDAIKNYPREIETALWRTSQAGIQVIEDRTAKGKGINGVFTPYTPEYEAYKKRLQGKFFQGVNLSVTNEMLGSMIATKPRNNKSFIRFSRPKAAEKAVYNNRIRPFFGFNQREEGALRTFFRKEFFS